MSDSIRTLLYIFSISGFTFILLLDVLKIVRAKPIAKKIEGIRWTLFSLASILILFSGSLTLVFIMLIAEIIGFSAIRHYKKLI